MSHSGEQSPAGSGSFFLERLKCQSTKKSAGPVQVTWKHNDTSITLRGAIDDFIAQASNRYCSVDWNIVTLHLVVSERPSATIEVQKTAPCCKHQGCTIRIKHPKEYKKKDQPKKAETPQAQEGFDEDNIMKVEDEEGIPDTPTPKSANLNVINSRIRTCSSAPSSAAAGPINASSFMSPSSSSFIATRHSGFSGASLSSTPGTGTRAPSGSILTPRTTPIGVSPNTRARMPAASAAFAVPKSPLPQSESSSFYNNCINDSSQQNFEANNSSNISNNMRNQVGPNAINANQADGAVTGSVHGSYTYNPKEHFSRRNYIRQGHDSVLPVDSKTSVELKNIQLNRVKEVLTNPDNKNSAVNALKWVESTRAAMQSVVHISSIALKDNSSLAWLKKFPDESSAAIAEESKNYRPEDFSVATGVIISHNLVVTNYHVLACKQAVWAGATISFNYLSSDDQKEYGQFHPDWFFWSDENLDIAVVAFTFPKSFYENEENYTLAKLDAKSSLQAQLRERSPYARISLADMVSINSCLSKDGQLTIIGHPDGRSMELSMHGIALSLKNPNCKIPSAAASDDLSTAMDFADGHFFGSTDDPYIFYSNDTQSGSSGSPVFMNDAGKLSLVAIHHSGVEETMVGYMTKLTGEKLKGVNVGTLICAVIQSLIILRNDYPTENDLQSASHSSPGTGTLLFINDLLRTLSLNITSVDPVRTRMLRGSLILGSPGSN